MDPLSAWHFPRRSTQWWTGALAVVFIVTRCLYLVAGVKFDVEPLSFYWQFIDPVLLRSDMWRSIAYLHEQMPGFNLFLAMGLTLFGDAYSLGFQLVYLAMGLTLALCLFHLLIRLRVTRALAFVIAAVFTANPATVLYENILFYEYPIATLFCVAALLLHRYLSEHRYADGIAFFACVMLIGYLRVTFHLWWMIVIIVFVGWMSPLYWRTTVRSSLVPLLLLTVPYVKNAVLFGTVAIGSDFINGTTLLLSMAQGVSANDLIRLREQGKISDLVFMPHQFLARKHAAALEAVVPLPPATGIPLLDQLTRSTGEANQLGRWKSQVGQLARRDAMAILREHPSAVLRSAWMNLRPYLRLADDGFPFDGRSDYENTHRLARFRALYHAFVGGYISSRPLLLYVIVPILLLFGAVVSVRTLNRRLKHLPVDPEHATLLFCYANVVWVSVVVICMTYVDQSRYMFEVSSYMAVLLGTCVERLWRTRERVLTGTKGDELS